MQEIRDLRILHILSPLKWKGDTYNHDADSNWSVCCKTIKWLPECHHYVLVPFNHNISFNQNNVSLIKYNYPTSVHINRGTFDYRNVRMDLSRIDIDFVFNHQPELTFNIHQWFQSKRYYEDVAYFGFYHWIDCIKSRGSSTAVPSFYMRQLEAMHILDCNFVHSEMSIDYLMSNFKKVDLRHLLSKVTYMPLTSTINDIPTQFEIPNKKILLFNHRWNDSSGIKKMIDFTEKISNDYVVWVTDERCDVKRDNFIIKHLKYTDYLYLVQNCYACLCFIGGYSTWNLSAQDAIIMGRPLLYYNHKTRKKIIGENYEGSFSNLEGFLHLLDNLPDIRNINLKQHDIDFETNLKNAITNFWKDTKTQLNNEKEWITSITNGITSKPEIIQKVYGNSWGSSSVHFMRRHLLNNGIRDNINSPYTDYYLEGIQNTQKRDLFNQ